MQYFKVCYTLCIADLRQVNVNNRKKTELL